jgi:hypothetical protein
MKPKGNRALAHYFGLLVEVLSRMESCSLIRFRGRDFIVDTTDLVFSSGLRQAA